MKTEELEATVKTLSETVTKLEARLTRMEDIEAIKKLQRAYGYYLEHWQDDQILDLWSHRDDVSAQTGRSGQYRGWKKLGIVSTLKIITLPITGEKGSPRVSAHSDAACWYCGC